MFCRSFKMFLYVSAIMATLAWAGSTSADIVAQYAGPHTFDRAVVAPVLLDNQAIDVGAEGTIHLTFQAAGMPADVPCKLWYLGNPNASSQTGEMQLQVGKGSTGNGGGITAMIWESGYVLNWPGVAISDMTVPHTVSFSWKNGSDSLLTVDGVTTHFGNAKALSSFTSDTNAIGAALDGPAHDGFAGTVRDVVVYNEYNVPLPTPEPSMLVLMSCGMCGLLAYAWRKRR
jgi:hypothetical protein